MSCGAKMNFTAVSLFCGAGGMNVGFQTAYLCTVLGDREAA